MLAAPTETPYDLNFAVGRTAVRVHPIFWIFSAILGWTWVDEGLLYLAVWVFCVFVSVLLHELGHVWMGRLFGSDGEIVLYGFGGLAIGASDVPRGWQRILVYLAGPGMQFAVAGVIEGILRTFGPDVVLDWPPAARIGLGMLWVINIVWPIFNLLPVWPLDGGNVSREVCEAISPRFGAAWSLRVSLVTAAFLAVNAFLQMNGRALIPLPIGGMYMALMFGLLAFESYQLLQRISRPWP